MPLCCHNFRRHFFNDLPTGPLGSFYTTGRVFLSRRVFPLCSKDPPTQAASHARLGLRSYGDWCAPRVTPGCSHTPCPNSLELLRSSKILGVLQLIRCFHTSRIHAESSTPQRKALEQEDNGRARPDEDDKQESGLASKSWSPFQGTSGHGQATREHHMINIIDSDHTFTNALLLSTPFASRGLFRADEHASNTYSDADAFEDIDAPNSLGDLQTRNPTERVSESAQTFAETVGPMRATLFKPLSQGVDSQELPDLLSDGPRTTPHSSATIYSGDALLMVHHRQLKVRVRARKLEAYNLNKLWSRTFKSIFYYANEDEGYHAVLDPSRTRLARRLRSFALSLTAAHSSATLRQKLLRLPVWLHDRVVAPLLVGSLLVSARHFFGVLQALGRLPCSKDRAYSIRMQCLHYLDITSSPEIEADQTLKRTRLALIEELSDPEHWPKRGLIKPWLDILMRNQPVQAESIALSYLETFRRPSHQAVLYLVDFWIRRENIDAALKALSRLSSEFLQESNDELLIRCTRILRFDTVETSDNSLNFRLLPKVLALGVRPNAFMHNQIVKTALDQAQHQVAWDLYRYMKMESISLRPSTCLLLLRDAFKRGKSEEMEQVMADIHVREELSRHPHLLSYQMHVVTKIGYYDRGSTSEEILSNLLLIYDRAWHRSPLVRLKLTTLPSSEAENTQLLEPDARSLSFMLWSYLLSQRVKAPLERFWARFQELVQAGDISMVEAARHDIIYNGLILAFGRRQAGVKRLLAVLNHMLEHNLCRPSSLTWDLVVCTLFHHRQFAEIEHVTAQMKSHGIALSEDRWKDLLSTNSSKSLTGKIRSILDELSVAEQVQLSLIRRSLEEDSAV